MSDAEDKFWSRVRIGDGCWEWTKARNNRGYGMLSIGGRSMLAHRVSWEFANGPIPPGMHVLHRCDNPGCVRPGHLFLGTPADNVADMLAKGRGRAPKGENHKRAKLTEADVLKIRALVASGMSQRQAGEGFGVSGQAVGSIVRGETWRQTEGCECRRPKNQA